ncbi:hypothetical protein QBC46DRAFT_83709 [Diplogelasinospora grovesii]|uniref:Rhodopsin domain-containing protein n=1 Tax=Diplogelasinospora grovesii TaxID=303347 RepID=A0AAN6RZJ8_9PEZI|nr:hypothetical protein QBC46DRAFT_83709 [Diplogelasinospora grovesii]
MTIGGQAPMAMGAMWFLTIFSLVFVGLRYYTRAVIVRQMGWDDHVYLLSGLFLLFYTLFMQVSSGYGFGQAITDLTLDDAVNAVKWEMVGQTFAVLGMAIAKLSLGLFLLRIVVETWHRVAIWIASASLLLVSVMTAIVFWIQCLPSQSIFDPRVPGHCIIEVEPFSILLGSWCAAVDFFFAGFPWLFIWKLNMRYNEKATIAASMSLGLVAGICGIIRTVELSGLASRNYTQDTVNLIIWSAAEIAVTMVCAGVPILRPLWRRTIHGTTKGSSSRNTASNGYYRHGDGKDGTGGANSYRLKKMGGASSTAESDDVEANHAGHKRDNSGFPDANPKLGIRGPTTVTYIEAREDKRGVTGHSDEETILGPEFRRSQASAKNGRGGIQVREDVDVRVE